MAGPGLPSAFTHDPSASCFSFSHRNARITASSPRPEPPNALKAPLRPPAVRWAYSPLITRGLFAMAISNPAASDGSPLPIPAPSELPSPLPGASEGTSMVLTVASVGRSETTSCSGGFSNSCFTTSSTFSRTSALVSIIVTSTSGAFSVETPTEN